MGSFIGACSLLQVYTSSFESIKLVIFVMLFVKLVVMSVNLIPLLQRPLL
jgi:hypothetical protein